MNSPAATLTQLTPDISRSPLHDQWGYTKNIWLENLKTEVHFSFFLKILDRTIDSIEKKIYTNFDAQTTSNCCHGLSILIRGLLLLANELDLDAIRSQSHEASLDLDIFSRFIKALPGSLIDLMSSYLLCWIVEIDPVKGRRTNSRKLKEIENLNTNFCRDIVKNLQQSISNVVAESYETYLKTLSEKPWIGGTSIGDWGQFIKSSSLRKDRKNTKYASCAFSMQVSLAFLLASNCLVALVKDTVDPGTRHCSARNIFLLRGNNTKNFQEIDPTQFKFSSITNNEPVVIFGGYKFDKNEVKKNDSFQMQPWIYQFPSLVLACDMNYPQFPDVKDDPNFDSSPIFPRNTNLINIMVKHKKIKGTSARDPSLFCLSHIFVASLQQVINQINTSSEILLPSCFLSFQS